MAKKATQSTQTDTAADVSDQGPAPAVPPGAPDQSGADVSLPGDHVAEPASTEIAATTDTSERRDGAAGEAAGRSGALFDATVATEAEFVARYPATHAAIQDWKASHGRPPRALKIVAKKEGFRRAGMAHTRAGAEHPMDAFRSLDDLEALFSEPNLVVTFV